MLEGTNSLDAVQINWRINIKKITLTAIQELKKPYIQAIYSPELQICIDRMALYM